MRRTACGLPGRFFGPRGSLRTRQAPAESRLQPRLDAPRRGQYPSLAASDAKVVAIAPVASLSRANASQIGAVSHTCEVRTRPLGDVVRESGVVRVDAIKIDVEGDRIHGAPAVPAPSR